MQKNKRRHIIDMRFYFYRQTCDMLESKSWFANLNYFDSHLPLCFSEAKLMSQFGWDIKNVKNVGSSVSVG